MILQISVKPNTKESRLCEDERPAPQLQGTHGGSRGERLASGPTAVDFYPKHLSAARKWILIKNQNILRFARKNDVFVISATYYWMTIKTTNMCSSWSHRHLISITLAAQYNIRCPKRLLLKIKVECKHNRMETERRYERDVSPQSSESTLWSLVVFMTPKEPIMSTLLPPSQDWDEMLKPAEEVQAAERNIRIIQIWAWSSHRIEIKLHVDMSY